MFGQEVGWCGYENDFNTVGPDGSESHPCGASFIHCAVEGISTPREELGIHNAGHNTWVLAERKGVIVSILSVVLTDGVCCYRSAVAIGGLLEKRLN